MVKSIARQSVVLKCLRRRSVLTGNYEFYYLAGLMKKLYGLPLEAEMQPQELLDHILEQLPSLSPGDEREAWLLHMVSIYEVLKTRDSQMEDLFRWGEQERDLWQVNTSYQG